MVTGGPGTGDDDDSLALLFLGVGLSSLPPALPLVVAAFFLAASSAATARLSASSWASRAAVSPAS